MAGGAPPPGFVLDDAPAPPSGFQIDDKPPHKSNGAGAFVRGATRSALPTAGGIVAFGPGAAAGAAITAPIAPLAGPFAPLVTGGGALLGGAASSLGAGWAVGKAQNYVLDQFPALEKALGQDRSEEHTSELQSLMRISYAVFCLKKKK